MNMHFRRTQSLAAWLLLLLVCSATLTTHTAVADDKSVFGYWKRLDDDTGKPLGVFRLWQDKGKLVGAILKSYPKSGEKPQVVCSECSGAQHDKPLAGLIFLWNFVRDDDNPKKWVDGKVLNPENGKVYNCEVELSEDGKTLNVYGYLRLLIKVGGTSKWVRATPQDIQGL
jgi:uncharacterized protein (DUF2147 family)